MQDTRNNDFIVQYKNMSQQCFSKHDKVVPFNNKIYLPRQMLAWLVKIDIGHNTSYQQTIQSFRASAVYI